MASAAVSCATTRVLYRIFSDLRWTSHLIAAIFYSDLFYSSQSSRLACFSSIGPTSDGRIKPDVVAPGDFVQSAWSGDPSVTLKALLGGEVWAKDGGPSCAVHQMSGTSMATPVTGERR